MKKSVLFILLSFVAIAQSTEEIKAKKLADEVVKAMGGRKAYDNTRHISWNFFGSRKLTWDKWTGRVRIDFLKEKSTFIFNVNTKTGEIIKNDVVQTHPDSINKYVKQGINMWINDSYWLLMPFKLHDEGVSLKYIGFEKTQKEEAAEVIQLSFNAVGVTPDNGYKIYIDPKTKLVSQWAFFRKANQEKPDFILAWDDYRRYGKILLSGSRGERKLTDIKVYDKLPDSVYETLR